MAAKSNGRSVSFYLIVAIGSEKEVRRAARRHGVRLRRIIHREHTEKGTESAIGASVPRRCAKGLKDWFDESAVSPNAAEAALPPDQLAIYKDSDSTAKLALDHRLLDTGVVPTGILHRYNYFETPLRDFCWMVLKVLAFLLLIPVGVICLIL
jgi:hypothetical protein